MRLILMVLVLYFFNCAQEKTNVEDSTQSKVELIVLGTVQDGGAPHIGCAKACCEKLWKNPDPSLKVVSLGVIDRENEKVYILEATPDFPEQMASLNSKAGRPVSQMPDGIFITHAHIGHYTGLMYLGREAKGSVKVPVYAMPKLNEFLSNNGPWDQLVNLQNIHLNSFDQEGIVKLTSNIKVEAFTVPHRDEYSETVGFVVHGPNKKVLFIPDIDKWSKWEEDIKKKIKEVDVAFLDATFYDGKEINNRDISEIPHPFVIESIELFGDLPLSEKEKVHFIHLNHTNPLLNKQSEEYKSVNKNGFNVAQYKDVISI